MKITTPIVLMSLLYTLASNSLFSQDVHFSHIHASPTFINPSMNGMFNEGDIRFIANARSQWNAFTNGYKTVRGSVDGKIARAGNAGMLNGGLELFADSAGDLDFTTISANASIGVSKALDRYSRQVISLGFQAGYTTNSIDYSKMVGFEEESFPAEVPDKISYVDFSFGGSWFGTLPNDIPFYIGLSMSHLNKPDVSFFKDYNPNPLVTDVEYIPIFKKISIQGGMNIPTGQNVFLMPSFAFSDQGPHQEINMGTYTKYRMSRKSDMAFYFGAWVRWHVEPDIAGFDALIASVRFDKNNTFYAFSYDINLSTLSRASHMMGGLELSIIKILETNRTVGKRSRVVCPIYF